MDHLISENSLQEMSAFLSHGNNEYNSIYPGEYSGRQPVHTVYGGAQLFKSTTTQKIGEIAYHSFKTFAPGSDLFNQALKLGTDPTLMEKVYARVEEKLKTEAVEDFRIDFEDGFGHRPDKEEDETAIVASNELARALEENTLSPFIGIRIKPLTEELKIRSMRTLDIFLTNLLKKTGEKLPKNFVVTLPKITNKIQVEALSRIFTTMEQNAGLPQNSLKMEFMVEIPGSIFTASGKCALPGFVECAQGRCVAAHFGTYDYTASVNITSKYQEMDHPACDFAKSFMKVNLAGSGLWLSDGATNIMPAPPHKDPKSDQERTENQDTVHNAWALSARHIKHSLVNGFYQGWDLHPGQIPARYGTLYAFFLEGLDAATLRLKNFMDQASKATLSGDIFDDAATGQGLLNYFLRALNCGAITLEDVSRTGLTKEEIETRSFAKILKGRRGEL